MLRSRFECKYYVPPERVDAVRDFLSPYLRHDPFSRRAPGYSYPVNSLYLDTPGRDLYQMTVQGHKNRFKLRVRTYSDDDPFVFFEVKRRLNAIIEKDRKRVDRELALDYFRGRPGAASAAGVTDFERLALPCGARPTLRVKYLREALTSRSGAPIRVTFDTRLQYASGLLGELEHGGDGWQSVPLRGVILEVKFTSRYPSWLGSLVHGFELTRTSIPKYILSTDQWLGPGRARRLVPFGVRVPDRRARGMRGSRG